MSHSNRMPSQYWLLGFAWFKLSAEVYLGPNKRSLLMITKNKGKTYGPCTINISFNA